MCVCVFVQWSFLLGLLEFTDAAVCSISSAGTEDHKVKQETHKIIYNVLRCPMQMREVLAQVYGEYRHFNAGSAEVCMCTCCG